MSVVSNFMCSADRTRTGYESYSMFGLYAEKCVWIKEGATVVVVIKSSLDDVHYCIVGEFCKRIKCSGTIINPSCKNT